VISRTNEINIKYNKATATIPEALGSPRGSAHDVPVPLERIDERRQVLTCGAVRWVELWQVFLFRARDVLEPLEYGRYVIIRRSGESHTWSHTFVYSEVTEVL
jgi:hypothetical protein